MIPRQVTARAVALASPSSHQLIFFFLCDELLLSGSDGFAGLSASAHHLPIPSFTA